MTAHRPQPLLPRIACTLACVAAAACQSPAIPGRGETASSSHPLTAVDTSPGDFGGGSGVGVETGTGSVTLAHASPWWDTGWHYRFRLDVAVGPVARWDLPVETAVDFSSLLAPAGSPLDPASVRVIEVDGSGNSLAEAPSRYDQGASPHNGLVLFVMTGTTPAGSVRHYQVYFDTAAFGPKPAPAHYASAASSTVGNAIVQWTGLGQDAYGAPDGLGFSGAVLLASGLDHVNVRHNKITSSDGSYATQSVAAGFNIPLAPSYYAVSDPARTLLADPALAVNRMVALAGHLRIAQYTVLTSGAATRMALVFENTGSAPITGASFIDGGDYDLGGASADDLAAWVSADGVVYGSDGSPSLIGMRAVPASAHHQVGDRTAVLAAMGAGLLTDEAVFGPGDFGFAEQYSLPDLAPGEAFVLDESWALASTGYADIEAPLLAFSAPLSQSLGPMEGYSAALGTFDSRILDSGDPATTSWQTISWTAVVPPASGLVLQTRTGPSPVPDGSWSAFSAIIPATGSGSAPITSPQGRRYLQYRLTLRSSDAGGSSPRVDDVTVHMKVAPAKLVFLSPPAVLAVGGTPTPPCTPAMVVQAQDAQGDPANITAGVALSLTSSSPTGAFYADAACTVAASAQLVAPADSATFYYSDRTAGTHLITVASPLLVPASQDVVVNPGPPRALAVVGFPSPQIAGLAGGFSVAAVDALGNVVPGYAGTVSFSSSDPAATLPASYSFVPADAGLHAFQAILRTAGLRSIAATDSAAALSGAENGIVVQPAGVATLAVAGFPSPQTAGASGGFSVTALDALGNVVVGYAGTVLFSSSDPTALLPASYTFGPGDAGAHAFSAALRTAGTQSLSAVDAAGGVGGSQGGIIVAPGPAVSLGLDGFPSSTAPGLAGSFTVSARDACGNVAGSYAGTVRFTSSDLAATLPADYTFTPADAGSHLFEATLVTAGSQSLTATDAATSSLTATQSGIVVSAAAPVALVVSGFPSPVTAGRGKAFTVVARDVYGNAATSYRGTVHFTSSDPRAVLPADYTFTALDAGARSFDAAFVSTGVQSLGAADLASPGLAGTQQGITVEPAPVAALELGGFPSPAVAGTSRMFLVSARDAFGNLTPGYAGTVHFSATDPAATLPPDWTFGPADSGHRTFEATFRTSGPQALTVADVSGAAAAGTQSGITIDPAPASMLVVSGFPSPVVTGVGKSFTVTARDPFLNVAVGYCGTVQFSSSDPAATLPAPYAFVPSDRGARSFPATLRTLGTQSLTASDGALSGTQGGLVVRPVVVASALRLSVAASIPGCTAVDLRVDAVDDAGNVASDFAGTVHFTSSDPQAGLPADYTFLPADAGSHSFPGGLLMRTSGAQSVSATSGAFQGSTPVAVRSGDPDHLGLSAATRSGTAGWPVAVTARALDACGLAAPAVVRMTVTASRSGTLATQATGFIGNGTATVSGPSAPDGTVLLQLDDLVAEAVELGGAIAGVSGKTEGASVTFGPGPAHHLRMTPDTVAAAACTDVKVQLAILDAHDNAVPGERAVTLTFVPAGGAVFTSTTLTAAHGTGTAVLGGTTLADGTASATFQDRAAEVVALRGSAAGLGAGPDLSLHFSPGALSASRSTFGFDEGKSPVHLAVGGRLTARIGPRDGCDLAVSVAPEEVSLDAPAALVASAPVAESDGSVTIALRLPACPADPDQALSVKARVKDLVLTDALGSPAIQVVKPECVLVPDPVASTFTLSGTAATACWTLSETDPGGIPIALSPVRLTAHVVPALASGAPLGPGHSASVVADGAALRAGRAVDRGDGSYDIDFGSDHCDAAPRPVAVLVDGISLARTAEASFRCAPVDPARSALKLDPADGRGGSGQSIGFAIAASDQCALPAFGRSLQLSLAPQGLASVEAPARLDDGGVAAGRLFPSRGGDGKLAVTVDGVVVGERAVRWQNPPVTRGGCQCATPAEAPAALLALAILARRRRRP